MVIALFSENQHPISVLFSCSKILERYVRNRLPGHVGHLMVKEQDGFVNRACTASSLFDFINFVAKFLSSQQEVRTIYTDFAKVFDPANCKIKFICPNV